MLPMIPIGIQILAATYAGSRLLDCYSGRKKRTSYLKDQPLARGKPQEQGLGRYESDGDADGKRSGALALSSAAVALTSLRSLYPPLALVTLVLISFVTVPILKEVETSLLKERRIKNDLLNSLASVGCMATGYYLAASLLAWFYHLGTRLISRIQGDARRRLTDAFEIEQDQAYVRKDGVEIECDIDDISLGDIVVVTTGETIPVDGVITAGTGAVDQRSLTGEFMPCEKTIGDNVFAATLVVAGRLEVRTEKAGLDTTVAKLNSILANTADFKSNIQVKGEKWANGAAAPLLTIGLASLPALGFTRIMMLLYSSPGNNIRVLTSLQTLNYLALVAHSRVLVKDGRALELLKDADTVLFDKTGTLTTEQPQVGEILLVHADAAEVLTYAAAAERRLRHPIAKAIIAKAEGQGLILPEITDANYKVGYGISGTIAAKNVMVGSVRFMTEQGIDIPAEISAAVAATKTQEHSFVMVAVDRRVKGAIEIKPQLRPELHDLVVRLRARGVTHCAIVSGDHERPTRDLATQLGMDAYYSDVLPEHKAEIVERLRSEGRTVCFVGDGINDAIAMKSADVSISLAGAASAATDLAQIIFLDGTLGKLDELFRISEELNGVLRQSVLICVAGSSVNVIAVYFWFLGVLPSLLLLSAVVPALGVSHAMLPLLRINREKHRDRQRNGASEPAFGPGEMGLASV